MRLNKKLQKSIARKINKLEVKRICSDSENPKIHSVNHNLSKNESNLIDVEGETDSNTQIQSLDLNSKTTQRSKLNLFSIDSILYKKSI